MRGALIGTQTELAETQAELDAWTHELDSFQQVGNGALQVAWHDEELLLKKCLAYLTDHLCGVQSSATDSTICRKLTSVL